MSHNEATRRPLYDHELKLQPPHFQDMLERRKLADLRREDDRRFEVGQRLLFREWIPEDGYTDRAFSAKVTHILRDTEWLPAGVAMISIAQS